jgi:hypothetical protein
MRYCCMYTCFEQYWSSAGVSKITEKLPCFRKLLNIGVCPCLCAHVPLVMVFSPIVLLSQGPYRAHLFPVSLLVRVRNMLPSSGLRLECHYLATGLQSHYLSIGPTS